MFNRIVCVAVIALSAAACAKSPEDICAKLEELDAKSDKADKKAPTKEDSEKCVAELVKMKETSPEAYDCVSGCADQSKQEGASACMFACVLSDEKLSAEDDKKTKDSAAATEDQLGKIVDQPVKPIKGKMKTFDDKPFGFSLSLAEGFTEDTSMATDTIRSWDVKIPGLLTGPNVTLMPTLAPDFERDVQQAAELKETVVKKEKTKDGHVITTESKGMLKAEVVVTAGARAVGCKATLFDEGAAKQKEKFLPWLEKMCRSLTIE